MSRADLDAALDALTKAHGSSELADAFSRVKAAVKKKRREEKASYGPLATAIKESLEMRDRMKAGGMSGGDLNRGLEGVLRELWPKPHNRSTAWSYMCDRCQDYGLEMQECPGDATCGFLKPHGPHTYGKPCFCVKGHRFREKPKGDPDDTTDRASKQKKLSKWGR
jgi:hypothetical protein